MVLPPRSITLFLSGIALCTVIALSLLYPATTKTFCTPSYSVPHSVPYHSAQLQHDRKVHLILPINAGAAGRSAGPFCKTLLSTLVHGYEPTIVNWDIELDEDSMMRRKVNGVHEYLSGITDKNADTDLVLMVDALDVWFQLSPRTLVERFDELGTSGVVASAEINCCCWPWSPAFDIIKDDICRQLPNSTVPKGVYDPGDEPRAINAGTVIGSLAAMRTLFKDLVEEMPKPDRLSWTDQGLLNEFFVTGRQPLSVDYHSRLVWATAYSAPTYIGHFINTPHHIDSLVPHELYPPLVYHAITGEVPVIIHFNGPDKVLIEEWWEKLWWNQLQDGDGRFRDTVLSRMKGAVVRFAGAESKEWKDLCPTEAEEWGMNI